VGRIQRSHREVVGGDLKYPALCAQARRRQGQFGARSQRELPARREAQRELGDRVQALPARYCLGMVEQHSEPFSS
jgi:hypothetical protein